MKKKSKSRHFPLEKHANCSTKVVFKRNGPHIGHYYCLKHKMFIAWIKKDDEAKLRQVN